MWKTGTKWARTTGVVVLVHAMCAGVVLAQVADKQVVPPAEKPLLKQLKKVGKNASLTILPARLAGKPVVQVGEVVGLMLEKAGMNNLEIGDTQLPLPETADLAQTGKALGEFVKANPPKTDYTLFVDFQVSPQRRFSEIRGVIVNKAGEVVWDDRQTSADADFRRINPKEPMQCCLLVVERLRPVLGLTEATGKDAHEGKIAKRFAEKSGVPSKTEMAAMHERQQVFKKAASQATLLIYPGRAGDEISSDSAANLGKLINEAKLTKASMAAHSPLIKVQGDINEQKVLWGMARAFREYVQKQPPDADYVLYTDYLMGKDAGGKDAVGAVHFAICDRQGQWVIVDYQNNHHTDFKAIGPKSRADCDRLVVKRLQGYCR